MWIPGASGQAKTVVRECYWCRVQDKREARQIMGELPPERLATLAPFEATALDLFGPFYVRDPAKGRRSFKCWVVAYVCLGTKSVCLLPCPGYGTDVFVVTHRHFMGIYGRPKLVYSDHAPSIIRASEAPDWEGIAAAVGTNGTTWRLTPKGCSWRNGLAERVIRAARHTLAHEITRGDSLDFHEFGALLAVASSIINSRPLSVRRSTDGDYHSISPRDVLLGRTSHSLKDTDRALTFAMDTDDDQVLVDMGQAQASIINAWWSAWMSQVFPDLVARSKWKTSIRNIKVGDIGHLRYDKKLGKDAWRLAIVTQADPDPDGCVRTISVSLRPRHKADSGKPYIHKTPQDIQVGIQRFAVLLAAGEEVLVNTASSMT